MATKKKPMHKKTVCWQGKKYEVDGFRTSIKLGSGSELDNIEEILEGEKIERAIVAMLKKIEIIAKGYTNKKNLHYYYKVGKILQFVDKEGLTDVKGLVWQRMAYDLRPDLFCGKKKDPSESKRQPEIMYHLGKQSEGNLKRATWSQWYEIVKFKTPDKSKWLYEDKNLLEQVFVECKKSLSGPQLRKRIEEIRDKFERKTN